MLHNSREPITFQSENESEYGEKSFDADDNSDDFPQESFVLKIERLGRTSFRTVKSNRDYVGHRKHLSWMYMSRLAAEKEWSFLNALYSHGFPTPKPVDWNRHCIVMEYIEGRVLEQLHREDWPEDIDILRIAEYLYSVVIKLLIHLAEHGLIHGDFNEFNLMVRESFIQNPSLFMMEADTARGVLENSKECPVVIIDFPQMISTAHVNAQEQFDRDVNCLCLFFTRRFGFEPAEWPDFERDIVPLKALDSELRASGHRNQSRLYKCGDTDDDDGELSEDEKESLSSIETE